MTDRAEPGVTPLTVADIAAFRDCEPYVRPVGLRRAGPNDGQVVGRIVPEWLFMRFLDAATPRPGLVEAIDDAFSRWERNALSDTGLREAVDDALASGTGEPGLDGTPAIIRAIQSDWRFQRLPDREPEGPEADAAVATLARLANDKGADR